MPDNDATPSQPPVEDAPQQLIDRVQQLAGKLTEQIGRTIVGQEPVIDQLLVALFCRGHAVLVGVPGLAKTLLVSTIAEALKLSFSRIQFTPDLMPSDITGTEVIEEDRATGHRQLRFVKGPVFANVILADEINRTPPKTQAALLEAMQEHHVTVGGTQHPLAEPFFVLATQNPIEQEGTYPLPEAQLDRFMFMIQVGYPRHDEEMQIVRQTTAGHLVEVEPVLSAEEVLEIQSLVRDVPVAEHVLRYALQLVRATRKAENKDQQAPPEFIDRYLAWGAGPRASQFLVLAGKARAILAGRTHVGIEDIAAVAHPVLRHRLITNYNAEADGIGTDDLIDRLLEHVDPAVGAEVVDVVVR